MTLHADGSITFDSTEALTLAHHLRTAADQYDADAKALDGSPIAQARGLAEQFRKQATETRTTAARIEGE